MEKRQAESELNISSEIFYIKDKLEQGDVIIEHKNTEDMWSDILTKTKQGQSFRKDRSRLMVCDVDWEVPENTNTHQIQA